MPNEETTMEERKAELEAGEGENGAESLPTKVDDADRLQMLLVNERAQRIDAQIALLQAERQQVVAEHQALRATLREKYGLSGGDGFDGKTGVIKRQSSPFRSSTLRPA